MNLPDLLARVENDRELLAELFLMLQEELPRLQSALHHALDAADQPSAASAAHALKGLLANMSMEKGASLAATIETASRAGDMSVIENAGAAFELEMAGLSAAVNVFIAGEQNANSDCR